MVLVVNFLIYDFTLFVPIFDLVHAVDAILIPLNFVIFQFWLRGWDFGFRICFYFSYVAKMSLASELIYHRTHYENTPMQYTVIFHGCKLIILR